MDFLHIDMQTLMYLTIFYIILKTKFSYNNISQYLFIVDEFWQIHNWITFSSYIYNVFKISRKLKYNSYVINKLFKWQVLIV